MSQFETIHDQAIDYQRFMQTTETKMRVRDFEVFSEEIDKLLRDGNKLTGATMPWGKTHDLIRFRAGEVSLWAGYSGHGKSQLLGQVCIGIAAQGERVCIASFEMSPMRTYLRMLQQVAGTDQPSVDFSHRLLAWMKGKMLAYDYVGSVDGEKLAAVIRYSAIERGVTHFVIDNLMKVIKGEDDYNGQKDIVSLLGELAKELNICVHLVHHLAKGRNPESVCPGKESVKGSGAIVALVDQVLIVHRNTDKEEKTQAGQLDDSMPDCTLKVAKNRNGEFEGRINLWYSPKSKQYTADSRRLRMDLTKGALP